MEANNLTRIILLPLQTSLRQFDVGYILPILVNKVELKVTVECWAFAAWLTTWFYRNSDILFRALLRFIDIILLSS